MLVFFFFEDFFFFALKPVLQQNQFNFVKCDFYGTAYSDNRISVKFLQWLKLQKKTFHKIKSVLNEGVNPGTVYVNVELQEYVCFNKLADCVHQVTHVTSTLTLLELSPFYLARQRRSWFQRETVELIIELDLEFSIKIIFQQT